MTYHASRFCIPRGLNYLGVPAQFRTACVFPPYRSLTKLTSSIRRLYVFGNNRRHLSRAQTLSTIRIVIAGSQKRTHGVITPMMKRLPMLQAQCGILQWCFGKGNGLELFCRDLCLQCFRFFVCRVVFMAFKWQGFTKRICWILRSSTCRRLFHQSCWLSR